MKKIMLIVTGIFLLGISSYGQLGKIKDKVKQKVGQRADQKTDEAIDKSLDKVEEGTKTTTSTSEGEIKEKTDGDESKTKRS